MIIGIDIMGGDNAPNAILDASLKRARQENKNRYVFYLKEGIEISDLPENVDLIYCSETIEMDDTPTVAVRRKKDSSMVRGLWDLKEKKIDGFVSAGSTGALLVGGMFITGRCPSVKRPAITGAFPTKKGFSIISDIGANADCQPEHLYTFYKMAKLYSQSVLNVENPTVGLLNIGSEKTKGNELVKDTFDLFEEKNVENFIGSVEANEVIMGKSDIVICDGYSGNIFLKTTEGTIDFLLGSLKEIFKKSIITKLSALIIKKGIYSLKSKMDPKSYGGAPILGIDGALVKAHGSSNKEAFYQAICYLEKYISTGIVEKIRNEEF